MNRSQTTWTKKRGPGLRDPFPIPFFGLTAFRILDDRVKWLMSITFLLLRDLDSEPPLTLKRAGLFYWQQ